MASWGLLFDRKRGHILDEFDGSFKRSWGINSIGECRFTLPINNSKNNEINFQFGNHLVVMNDNGLPPWSGRLETPRAWGNKTNKHMAVSHESFFRDRVGSYSLPFGLLKPAGVIFEQLIQIANEDEDTLIRAGDIFSGGRLCGTIVSPIVTLSDNIEKIIKQSGHEYEIVPVVANNRLALYGNWYARQGTDTGASLNDSNCRIEENSLSENGPIYNKLIGVGKEQQVRNHHVATDPQSVDRYGLRVAPYEVDAVEGVAVEGLTEQQLLSVAYPRRAFRATASNAGGLYDLLRKGNKLQFESTEAGYGLHGVIGTQASVRIFGMAYTDDQDGVALTIIQSEGE